MWRCVAVAAGLTMAAAPVRAEEVVLEAPPTVEQVQAAPHATVTLPQATITVAPGAVAPPPGAYLPPPLSALPPPPGAQGPIYFNGPVYVIPAPVTGQPLQALPRPPLYGPPPPFYGRYRYRPRLSSCCDLPPAVAMRYTPPVQRGPVFSMGARFTAMGVNQEVFGQKMNLLGGGVQLRFRNQGHWGFETGFDMLRANIGNDAFIRNSYPWTAGVMIYVFRNRPDNHFNLYGVGGLGLMADDITLYRGTQEERRQQFLEVMGHLGAGAELRFHRLAFSADIRAIGLALDTASSAGTYYQDVTSGPVPQSGIGYKANVAAMLAF